MVIKFFDAIVASEAVRGSRWSIDLTSGAYPYFQEVVAIHMLLFFLLVYLAPGVLDERVVGDVGQSFVQS